MGAEKALDPAGDVVDVPRLFDPADGRTRVAAAVPRVQNERDAREIRGADAVDELVGLEPPLLLLDALRIVGWTELRRQILDRNLDRVTHRDRADVRDPVSQRDLR